MTFRAVQAEPAYPQPGQPVRRYRHIGQQAGQHQIKNRPLGVHYAAGQAAHRAAVGQVAQHEHGPRQYRRTVAHNGRAALANGQRRAVVGVHAHAAGAQNQLHPGVRHFPDGRRDGPAVIPRGGVGRHGAAVLCQFGFQYRGESVLDQPFLHFAAGGHHAKTPRPERPQL